MFMDEKELEQLQQKRFCCIINIIRNIVNNIEFIYINFFIIYIIIFYNRVKIQNKNNKLAEHIEKMYKYYKDNRHPLCHTTATLLDIKIIENYEDVKRIIREVLELLDEAFDLHNSNGLKQ